MFRYNEIDRLTGAVRHSHSEQIVYRIKTSQAGTVSFQRDIPGKGTAVFERDASGNLALGENMKPRIAFFLPRQFFGRLPSALTVGQKWQVRLPQETVFGSPGTAAMSVTAVDQQARHIVLHAALRGEGDVSQMAPGDNAPTRFHTTTNRQAVIELTNGIIDSFVVSGDDKQSADGSTPINVHIEISVKRTK